ncbi:MAG: hypothetical protein KDI68_13685 [Gammaproteobacteria bacterium]|nr:hypothetical protein [Gammaproteobacteria bacterium]
MPLHFSQLPGRRERHLLRKQNNPLFPPEQRHIGEEALLEAQRLDHEELERFIGDFRRLVQRAVALQPNVGSEVVLELKEELDRAYERSAGLADDQHEAQQAILRLLDLLMDAVRRGAGEDQVALSELEQERLARQAHFELLRQPLVADLLDPDSPIGAEELAATLLSTDEEAFHAALLLFDQDQRLLLRRDAERLLQSACIAPTEPLWQRLAELAP